MERDGEGLTWIGHVDEAVTGGFTEGEKGERLKVNVRVCVCIDGCIRGEGRGEGGKLTQTDHNISPGR